MRLSILLGNSQRAMFSRVQTSHQRLDIQMPSQPNSTGPGGAWGSAVMECQWSLPEEIRSALGMGSREYDGQDVNLSIYKYGQARSDLSTESPSALIASFMTNNSTTSASGTQPARMATGAPPAAIHAGRVMLAPPGGYYAELWLYMCDSNDCGQPGADAARSLFDIVSNVLPPD